MHCVFSIKNSINVIHSNRMRKTPSWSFQQIQKNTFSRNSKFIQNKNSQQTSISSNFHSLIITIYKKLRANVPVMVKGWIFPPKIKSIAKVFTLSLLLYIVLVSWSKQSGNKEKQHLTDWKRSLKSSLLINEMIVCIENLKESAKKKISKTRTKEFNMVTGGWSWRCMSILPALGGQGRSIMSSRPVWTIRSCLRNQK
jgi:hypothetical protein